MHLPVRQERLAGKLARYASWGHDEGHEVAIPPRLLEPAKGPGRSVATGVFALPLAIVTDHYNP